MRMVLQTVALGSFVCLAGFAQSSPHAERQERPRTPAMLSFVTPLQAPTRDWDVTGLRANLVYGESHGFRGLDVGAAGRSTGDSKGLHIALLATVTEGDALGGQLGTVNYVKGSFNGLQAGVANYGAKTRGLQIGVFNGANDMSGFQLGLINVTHTMMGVQVGLVNVISDNDVPFIPLVNGYF